MWTSNNKNDLWVWKKSNCVLCGKECESIYGAICDRCLHSNKRRRSWLDALIEGILMVVGCGKK